LLQERHQAGQEWLTYARKEAESGFAAFDRSEGTRGTVDEHMARIDAAVRARVAQRAGNQARTAGVDRDGIPTRPT
jgi:hypothetical protein